jgi:acetylglutamate kinase
VNADTAASAIALALSAEKLVYLTDIDGLRLDKDDAASLVRRATAGEIRQMMSSGAIEGGMIPKMESCLEALDGGVNRTHLLDGRIPHVLLIEMFTDAGVGTMITKDSAS